MSRRPRPGRWTYAAYCRIPADRNRHEILDGRHYVTPSPEIGHQRAATRLACQLMRQIDERGLGETFTAPLDVHLGRGTVVQPDVVVVAAANRAVLGTKKITGVPDLLVEVLSPSSLRRDRVLKRERYQRAGVPEYWIVDLDARAIEVCVLADGRYPRATSERERVACTVLPGVTVVVPALFGPSAPA